MQEIKVQNQNFKNRILKHGLVLVTFLILTLIITFPVILDFGTEAAGSGCYDKCHMMWRMWWTNFSFDNDLDFYHSNYLFYPNGVPISGNLAQFTTGIGAILQNGLGSTFAWNIIWLSGFVFGGYGAYLLAEHFTKNPYASIVSGIIFTFSTYHMVHSEFHIGLSMIFWVPLFILVLFKILEENSKKLIFAGSAFFFLSAITHLYFLVFLVMFSIVFFAVFSLKQKNISQKTFVTNYSMILGIGIIACLIVFSPILFSDIEHEKRPIDEHIEYSSGLINFVTPTFFHSSQIFSENDILKNMYLMFNEDTQFNSHYETYSYLGYSVIVLSVLALKFKFRFSWFWVLVGTGSAILSLGPELKIINSLTGIIMPEKLLYDYLPGWDSFRAPGRFIMMTNLSMAILSAFAINGLAKSDYISKKILLIIIIVISSIIIFDMAMIPYPAYTEKIPQIYQEIKNDKEKFVVLESPVAGLSGDYTLNSHPMFAYYQTIHEKPIIGGYESRATLDVLKQTNTYFLKKFQLSDNDNDIVNQDLKDHGISILNYYNVKYVIIHKYEIDSTNVRTFCMINDCGFIVENNDSFDYNEGNTDRFYQATIRDPFKQDFILRTSNLMSEILDTKKPYFEDGRMIVYEIPKSNSMKPFILLGDGWFDYNSGDNSRAMYPTSHIKIINPNDNEQTFSLEIKLAGYGDGRMIKISINGEFLQENKITTNEINLIELNDIRISPGENIISIEANGYEIWQEPVFENKYQISLIGFDISGK